MKKVSTYFLQVVLVLMSIILLILLLVEPWFEGRNANATAFEVYFKDPFLAYIYLAFIAVFIGFYQAFILLKLIRNNQVFSEQGVLALRRIKYCAMTFITFLLGAGAWLFIFVRPTEEDVAGGVAMGLMLIFMTTVVSVAAAVFEHLLQRAADFKSENDLTV